MRHIILRTENKQDWFSVRLLGNKNLPSLHCTFVTCGKWGVLGSDEASFILFTWFKNFYWRQFFWCFGIWTLMDEGDWVVKICVLVASTFVFLRLLGLMHCVT